MLPSHRKAVNYPSDYKDYVDRTARRYPGGPGKVSLLRLRQLGLDEMPARVGRYEDNQIRNSNSGL